MIALPFYLDLWVPTYILYCNEQVLFCPYCQLEFYHSEFLSVGNDKNSESSSTNLPKGLFPSHGAKVIIFSTFSVISGSCNEVSVTPEVLSSISHHPSLPLSLQSVTYCFV